MSKAPAYRGLASDLNRWHSEVRDWFVNEARKAAATIHESAIKELVLLKLAEVSAADVWPDGVLLPGFYRQHSARYGSSIWGYRHKPASDYLYEFQVGQNQRARYGMQKLVMRKDGTLHEENLRNALWDWASQEISRKRSADTLTANNEEYERLQSPGKHIDGITVELKGRLGCCKITYSEYGVKLGPVTDVPLEEAQRMINTMLESARSFRETVKSIT